MNVSVNWRNVLKMNTEPIYFLRCNRKVNMIFPMAIASVFNNLQYWICILIWTKKMAFRNLWDNFLLSSVTAAYKVYRKTSAYHC